jgi:serine/threonine protein kinase
MLTRGQTEAQLPSQAPSPTPLAPTHQASFPVSLSAVDCGGGRALAEELLSAQSVEHEGMTLLHLAAWRGELDLLRKIRDLKKGNVTERTQKRQTALHIAAAATQESVCVELLKWSPELMDMKDNDQRHAKDLCPDRFWQVMINHRQLMGDLVPSAIGLAQRYVPNRFTADHPGRTTVVRRALDRSTGDTVALKYFASKDERDHERDILQLVGPTVGPRVIDTFEDDSSTELPGAKELEYVLVMEAADTHHSLKDFILTNSNAPDCELILAATAKRILTIVNGVHSLGVVHMDLKPEHFMYFNGLWKLIDFGSALVVGVQAALPSYTEGYCAPEVAMLRTWGERSTSHSPPRSDRALTLSPAIDIFSCGLVLFELFTGRRFFHGEMAYGELTDAKVRWRCLAYLHMQEKVFRIVLPMLNTDPARRPDLFELLNRKFFRAAEDTHQLKTIEVLAIFSSPVRLRGRRAEGSVPYLKLMRELMQLQQGIPEPQRVIRPAAKFPESISHPLREYMPRVIQFSGHASPEELKLSDRQRDTGIVGGTLFFEMEDGTAQQPPPNELVSLLYHQPQLQCIFLNACESESLARRIVKALPHLRVICWTTLVDNRAATAFSKGFYDSLGDSFRARRAATRKGFAGGRDEGDRIDRAYKAAAKAFADANFKFGDPRVYLDKRIANPPVAGKFAMVSAENVDAHDVAYGAIDEAPAGHAFELQAPPHVMAGNGSGKPSVSGSGKPAKPSTGLFNLWGSNV